MFFLSDSANVNHPLVLTELRIQNFKSWRDTGSIRLAPLTVFFGTNSSGKSSLNQLLLMLKQTAQSPDRQRVLHPGDRFTTVDLGPFDELSHLSRSRQGPAGKTLKFALTWTLANGMDQEDVAKATAMGRKIYSGKTMGFDAAVGLVKSRGEKIAVQHMTYQLGTLDEAGFQIGMQQTRRGTEDYKLIARKFEPRQPPGRTESIRQTPRVAHLPPPVHFYGFPPEATARYQNIDFVRDLTLELEQCLHDIFYLGPLRDYPQRSYTWSGENPEHVGVRGDRAVDAILAARRRMISAGPNKHPVPFEKMVARWLKDMGLIERFHVTSIGQRRRDYEVLVKTRGIKENVNLTDVGFGVSQVLPVIVECFYASARSTIIIEQPEVHLHPSVQASLADVFIEAIQAREQGHDRNIQLLIESHSEHFLRRLQLRIAQAKIAPEATALYFCRNSSDGSSIEPLRVDDYGNIINWPDDFFGDPIEDLVQMNDAAIRRKRAQGRK